MWAPRGPELLPRPTRCAVRGTPGVWGPGSLGGTSSSQTTKPDSRQLHQHPREPTFRPTTRELPTASQLPAPPRTEPPPPRAPGGPGTRLVPAPARELHPALCMRTGLPRALAAAHRPHRHTHTPWPLPHLQGHTQDGVEGTMGWVEAPCLSSPSRPPRPRGGGRGDEPDAEPER